MDRRKVLLAFALLCLGTVAMGCGNSDDETKAVTVEKAVFVQQGDGVCSKISREFTRSVRKLSSEAPENNAERGTPAWEKAVAKQQEREVEALLPILNQAAAEFRDTGRPQGDEQAPDRLAYSLEAASNDLEADPGQEVLGSASPFVAFDKMAKEKGLNTCAL